QTETINLREPNLETIRGTRLTLVANANRPIKEAQLKLKDDIIVGEPVKDDPLRVKFALKPLKEDGLVHYQVSFQPKTPENASDPRSFSIRVIADNPPTVSINDPWQEVVEVPANGKLPIKGHAEDDFGLTAINLRMKLVSPKEKAMDLAPQRYLNGKSLQS